MIRLAQPLLLIITQDISKTHEKRKNNKQRGKSSFCDDDFSGA
jgi:hypothetical protein